MCYYYILIISLYSSVFEAFKKIDTTSPVSINQENLIDTNLMYEFMHLSTPQVIFDALMKPIRICTFCSYINLRYILF